MERTMTVYNVVLFAHITSVIVMFARLHLPRMWQAVLTRAGLGIGVVFIMAVKPSAAVAGTAAALGALAGYSTPRLTTRSRRASTRPACPGPWPAPRKGGTPSC
jgi:hypothetical protein